MILQCEQGVDGEKCSAASSAAVPGLVPHSEHPLKSGAASEEANGGRFIHTYVLGFVASAQLRTP